MTTAGRLTALDGTFLELEDAGACAHMHIGSIMIFGPARAEERHRSRHCATSSTFRGTGSGSPPRTPDSSSGSSGVPDASFDVARHVLSAILPSPGGWEELLEWSGDYFSARLDRTMPLWQIMLVAGVADDHWALVTKTHHCLVDGIGAVRAAHVLLDDAAPIVGPDDAGPDEPSILSRLAPLTDGIQGAVRLATHPLDLAHAPKPSRS
ncbi:MAG: wax ester/triacylglycerol synthase family O-acyltransferase [Conexibacter sp.]|nr:wax ester/triacylglycerol synthase family O-acyltransferase [Conexibacter sp.]